MADIVLTGASGFVGRHLREALTGAGKHVIGTAKSPQAGLTPLDVTDEAVVRQFFRSLSPVPDAVVHLAAIAHPRSRRVAAADFDRVNHLGWRRVLEEGRAVGIRRFVLFSSAAVYGDVGRRVSETAPRRPSGAYAVSKRDAEDVAFTAMESGVAVTVLRFPVIYGEAFLNDLRARAYVPGMSGRVLLRITGAQPHYGLCAVENAVDAVRHLLQLPAVSSVFNVADREPCAQDTIRRIIGAADRRRACIAVPAGAAGRAIAFGTALLPRPFAESIRANGAKLFSGLTLDTSRFGATGFVPRYGIADLARLLAVTAAERPC